MKFIAVVVFAAVLSGLLIPMLRPVTSPGLKETVLQELRQNISDLQNRVYELESK